jgi:5,10-methylenetetrahydromethanopterin reductase
VGLRFAVQHASPSLGARAASALAAEQAGFELVGFGGISSWAIAAGLAAARTQRVRVGPGVAEPLTHHPLVDASAAAALHELAPGRTFLAFGSGDSIATRLGQRPATVARLREHVVATRLLLAGEPAEFGGRTCRLSTGITSWDPVRLPILIAGSGPRTIKMAGEVADGALVNVGVTGDAVQRAEQWIFEGAAAAGRDVAEVERWYFVVACCDVDGDRARERVASMVATSAHMAFRSTLDGKVVDDDLARRIEQFVEQYSVDHHGVVGRAPNVDLARRLGLEEYFFDRFAVAGTPGECRAQLGRMERDGVQGVWIASHVDERTFDLWGSQVLPAFTPPAVEPVKV